MSLKFLEMIYDYSISKWIWLDIRDEVIYIDNKKKEAPKNFTRGFYSMDWSFTKGKRDGVIQCSYCGLFTINDNITRDHVYPKSKGGFSTAPSCKTCNTYKADLKPIEWALYAYKNNFDIG